MKAICSTQLESALAAEMFDGQQLPDIDEEHNNIAKGHKNVANKLRKVQKRHINNLN